MPTKTLTDRFVAGVRPTARTTYFDTKRRGLALRVSPSGATKTWSFVYRNGGPPRWMTIGSYPALTLAEARNRALEHRKAIDVDGRDPVADRRAAERITPVPAFTFADLVGVYAAFVKGRKRDDGQGDLQKIRRYLLPAWGPLPLREIKREHVHELLDVLVAKGLSVGVNRVQAVISRLFTVALDRSLIDAHPAARMIKRFKERASERVLTDDEIRHLWEGLDAQPGPAADVIRLRLLLGQRGDEIIEMTWSEVVLDKERAWNVPGTRTKNGRAHTVPLPETAYAILERRRAAGAETTARVFPLSRFADEYRDLAAIHNGRYEWKDLRRTMATRLAGLGFDETVIGRTLNHARYTVTAKHYNQHQYLGETRAALDAWDREVRRILANEKKTGGAVVALGTRRSRRS